MQHNVPAAFFHLAQYSVCSSRRRCRRACVRACVRAACFLRLPFCPRTARCRRTQQYALRTSTRYAFGASSTFRWYVSVEKKFGLLFRCANLQLQCAATSISLALTSISLALTSISLAQTSFVLTPQQMAALNFLHFYFVKWFVKMDRKVTSNIKFKKYKILNKRSTNNVSNFLTFQTVFKKLIRIRTFDAGICFE